MWTCASSIRISSQTSPLTPFVEHLVSEIDVLPSKYESHTAASSAAPRNEGGLAGGTSVLHGGFNSLWRESTRERRMSGEHTFALGSKPRTRKKCRGIRKPSKAREGTLQHCRKAEIERTWRMSLNMILVREAPLLTLPGSRSFYNKKSGMGSLSINRPASTRRDGNRGQPTRTSHQQPPSATPTEPPCRGRAPTDPTKAAMQVPIPQRRKR